MGEKSRLAAALAELRGDLVKEDGPQISTMRNYRFAIVPYHPSEEFELRQQVQALAGDLVANGWVVISISLQKLMLDRIRSQGPEWVERMGELEKRITASDKKHDLAKQNRGLSHLKSKLHQLIEGPEGIAADCSRLIRDFVQKNPDKRDRTLALIGRAGALYPFFRSSALLRHLDGHTENVPVVLLYPGERRGPSGLSFMGVWKPENDYRPRIYG